MVLTRLLLSSCLLMCVLACNSHASEDASPAANAVFPIRQDGVWGAIDRDGNVLVEPAYTTVSRAYYHFRSQTRLIGQEGALLISPDEWLYVDAKGTKRVDPMIDHADHALSAINFGDSLFGVFQLVRSYQADGESKLVVHRFGAGSDDHGTIPNTVFDPSGRWNPSDGVLPRDKLSEGLICVSRDGRFGYANREGMVVVQPQYDFCSPFVEGLAAVRRGSAWGYINKAGRWVIKPRFAFAGWFHQGIARVVEPGRDKSYFIDKNGEELYECPITGHHPVQLLFAFTEGLMVHQDPDSGLYGFIDQKGEWRIQPRFKSAGKFSEGLAPVRYNAEFGKVVDQSGNRGPDAAQQEWVGGGYIDKKGQLWRAPAPNLRPFRYGLGGVDSTFGVGGYVNRAGEWVWPPPTERR